ncbi:CdaR family protein [Patiriisocius marinus]|uniref:CdaR family protein n=1 Tax=Patiriisocius marinus TaxID=1397112 RepID=UPI00232B480E|nr:YbbR-like domain-containing protein [Patiriisocius marinus]
MKSKVKNPFFNAKLRAFLFFLALATIFWVLTRFSKQDSGSVTANIVYTNVPKGKLLLDSNPENAKFILSANKFEILYHRIKKPTVVIDIKKYYSEKNGAANVTEETLKELIQSQINNSYTVQRVVPREIVISLESLNFKDVPVEIVSDLKFKSGFGESGAVIIDPKTVTITGASLYLDTITSVKTTVIKASEVSQPLNLKVDLQQFDVTKVQIEPKFITYKQHVVEFSQKRISLDITVLNAPSDATLRLLPSKIGISFNVPIENFNAITADDFTVTVDYNKRNQVDNFVIPEITKKPAGIKDIELGTKKVDLLLFK